MPTWTWVAAPAAIAVVFGAIRHYSSPPMLSLRLPQHSKVSLNLFLSLSLPLTLLISSPSALFPLAEHCGAGGDAMQRLERLRAHALAPSF
jgi:hypothetical protein